MAAVEVFPPPDDENPPKWWLISRSNLRSYLSWPKCVTSLYRSAKTESNGTPHAPNAPLRWWCVGPRAFKRWVFLLLFGRRWVDRRLHRWFGGKRKPRRPLSAARDIHAPPLREVFDGTTRFLYFRFLPYFGLGLIFILVKHLMN